MTRLALFISLCVALVACGQQQPAEPAPAPAEPAPAAPAPAAPAPAAPAVEPAPAPAAEPAPTEPAGQPEPAAKAPTAVPAEGPKKSADAPAAEAAKKPAASAPTAEAPKAAEPAPTPAAPTQPAQAAGPCGEKGQPHCPLQGWMEDHLQRAVEAEDLPALAKGLTRAAAFSPDPSWNAGEQGWSTIAKAGAAAATAGDLATAKQTCKTCHKAWRNKYKQSFRTRPVPN